MRGLRGVLTGGMPWMFFTVFACGRTERASAPQPSAVVASSAVGARVLAPGSAQPLTSASADARRPPAHCLAVGKSGTLTFGALKETEVQLAAEGDTLFALGYTFELARTRLYRASRAGGAFELVAEQKGIGERSPIALFNGAAYYTQAGKLIKLGPSKGDATKLYEGLHSPVAVREGQLFAIACDSKTTDHLLRISSDGRLLGTVAELPRASPDPCRYSSLAADGHTVFVADWNGSRVLAASLADHSVVPVVTKQGFPATLGLDSTGLWFTSALGVYHLDREGGALTRLVNENVALAPYARAATYADEHWVFDDTAYASSCNLYHLNSEEPVPKPFLRLRVTDPNANITDGFGLLDFTVDDECVYVAQTQYGKPGAQILVKAK